MLLLTLLGCGAEPSAGKVTAGADLEKSSQFSANRVVAFLAHTGPADKPFPLVILSALDRQQVARELHEPPFPIRNASYVRVDVNTIEQCLSFVRSVVPAETHGDGTFLLELMEADSSWRLFLDRAATRNLLALVQEGLPPGAPARSVIDALMNRLRRHR